MFEKYGWTSQKEASVVDNWMDGDLQGDYSKRFQRKNESK